MNVQFFKNVIAGFKKVFSPFHFYILATITILSLTFSCSYFNIGTGVVDDNNTKSSLTVTEVVVHDSSGTKVENNAIPVTGASLLVTFNQSIGNTNDVSGWTNHITLKTNGGNPVSITITNVEANHNQIRIAPQGDLESTTTYTLTISTNLVVGVYQLKEDYINNTLTTVAKKIKNIIDAKAIPTSFDGYDEVTKTIFSNYTEGATVTARYVKSDGSGDGTSWSNATSDLQGAINSIGDATNTNVYVVLVASGNYKPTNSYSMKNYVAIIGGFTANTYNRAGETQLDGNGARSVFYHNNLGLTNSAILYGLTITNGTNEVGGGMYNQDSSPTLIEVTFSGNTATDEYGGGGGMFNQSSSPTLIEVTFSGNTATSEFGGGGGMFNNQSSPTLINVTFSGNTAVNSGGGMLNNNSSPTLAGVTFSENTAMVNGGGMRNDGISSSPTLIGVTFSGNTADWYGGGMFNQSSSPTLIGVTFSANTATNGGGMNNEDSSPTLIGVTFSGNTANGQGGGVYHDANANNGSILTLINTLLWGNNNGNIFLNNDNDRISQKLNLYYSLVEEGGDPSTSTTGIRLLNANTDTYLINTVFISNITGDPKLGSLTDNGGRVNTISIATDSPAKDRGVFVQKSESTLYYSTNNTAWYSDPQLATAAGTLPADAVDLTTTDARGYGLSGRPDIGAYEVGGTAP